MQLEFKKINNKLYEWTSENGSIIKIYDEGLQEELPLRATWRYSMNLVLSPQAVKRMQKRDKEYLKDMFGDSLLVFTGPDVIIETLCKRLSIPFKTEITGTIKS